jgi:hypothetical protein
MFACSKCAVLFYFLHNPDRHYHRVAHYPPPRLPFLKLPGHRLYKRLVRALITPEILAVDYLLNFLY